VNIRRHGQRQHVVERGGRPLPGSFGVIFEGTNLLNQQQVAIKFEPRKSDAPQLRDEYRTYKILVGCRECLKFRIATTELTRCSRDP
jgi:hypothetical protein